MLRKKAMVVVACAALVLNGCGSKNNPGPLNAMVSPAIPPSVQEIPNPLRGQYEDLLEPLFPQVNNAQQRYPAWPASSDASLRVTWRQLQPTDPRTLPPDAPDDRKYDFSVIDDTLNKLAARNMRLTLRVLSYNSCCNSSYQDNTNIEIPDWVRAATSASTNYTAPSNSPTPGVTQVVPNWNDPTYLNGFGDLLAALGRRYDGDERLSVFEFSGYGDFSENHIAYLRDTLGAPGAAPDESVRVLGYYSQFRDQSITKASIQQLVAANVNAFPHTQFVVNPDNPEITRELLADDITKKLVAPVGIRSDCLGVQAPLPAWAESSGSQYVQSNDGVVNAIKQRLASALVITEWCGLPSGTAVVLREGPARRHQVPRVDDLEYQLSGPEFEFGDGSEVVSDLGTGQRLCGLPVLRRSAAGVAVDTGQGGDHRRRVDQLRFGGRHRKLGAQLQVGGFLGNGGSDAARDG
jgi:hypothetical protein